MAKTLCIYIPENDKKTKEAVKSINDRGLGISVVTRKLLCAFADNGFIHADVDDESEEK